MRILIHGINYSPELTGIGKYSGEMADWLAKRGHEVRVVTAPPYYPEWRVGSGYSAWRYRYERINSVAVWRCPLWVPGRPSGAKRLLHLASFALFSLPVMLRQVFWRPDVVLVVEPPLMCAPGAWLAARLCGGKAWLHIQDLEVDAAFELGILRSDGLKRWVLAAERRLMRCFDRVSTISQGMVSKLSSKGVSSDQIRLLPNWADLDALYPYSEPSPLRAEMGIPDGRLVLLYSGNMGEKQGLEIVLDAASRLRDAGFQFVMCGEGAARARLADRYGHLENVIWIPLQPIEKLPDLLNLADIHLLPQRADAADLVMPSKLTGMLATGRPVIATAAEGTQVAEVVKDCGLVVPPGDVEKFVAAIHTLDGDAGMRDRLGQAGRLFAESHLGRDVILSEFERDLQAV